jgi:hypothetical protein
MNEGAPRTELAATWEVAQQSTMHVLLTSDPDSTGSVLVFIRNLEPNPVAIRYGFDVSLHLRPNAATSLIRKTVTIRALRPDGSEAASPSDPAALPSNGEFSLTPLSCCVPTFEALKGTTAPRVQWSEFSPFRGAVVEDLHPSSASDLEPRVLRLEQELALVKRLAQELQAAHNSLHTACSGLATDCNQLYTGCRQLRRIL